MNFQKLITGGRAALEAAQAELSKLAGRFPGAPGALSIYHGSPHLFDAFDFENNLRKGEGALAYGPGGYATGHRPLAVHYAEQLAQRLNGGGYQNPNLDPLSGFIGGNRLRGQLGALNSYFLDTQGQQLARDANGNLVSMGARPKSKYSLSMDGNLDPWTGVVSTKVNSGSRYTGMGYSNFAPGETKGNPHSTLSGMLAEDKNATLRYLQAKEAARTLDRNIVDPATGQGSKPGIIASPGWDTFMSAVGDPLDFLMPETARTGAQFSNGRYLYGGSSDLDWRLTPRNADRAMAAGERLNSVLDPHMDLRLQARRQPPSVSQPPKPSRYLYEADLNVSPNDMLLYDAPYAEQNDNVKEALRNLGELSPRVKMLLTDHGGGLDPALPGGDFAHAVPQNLEGMKMLREAGIPTTAYLRAGPRGKGLGDTFDPNDFNFVIHDQDRVGSLTRTAFADGGSVQPTDAQKEAGNYKKEHRHVLGMRVSIENKAGSTRSGTARDGTEWSQQMQHDYGYFRGTMGKDKDHIDVFMGRGDPAAHPVHVIDQVDPESGEFDEHKVVLGEPTPDHALEVYHANYEPGWRGADSVTPTDIKTFKGWAFDGKRKMKPFSEERPGYAFGGLVKKISQLAGKGEDAAVDLSKRKLITLPSTESPQSTSAGSAVDQALSAPLTRRSVLARAASTAARQYLPSVAEMSQAAEAVPDLAPQAAQAAAPLLKGISGYWRALQTQLGAKSMKEVMNVIREGPYEPQASFHTNNAWRELVGEPPAVHAPAAEWSAYADKAAQVDPAQVYEKGFTSMSPFRHELRAQDLETMRGMPKEWAKYQRHLDSYTKAFLEPHKAALKELGLPETAADPKQILGLRKMARQPALDDDGYIHGLDTDIVEGRTPFPNPQGTELSPAELAGFGKSPEELARIRAQNVLPGHDPDEVLELMKQVKPNWMAGNASAYRDLQEAARQAAADAKPYTLEEAAAQSAGQKYPSQRLMSAIAKKYNVEGGWSIGQEGGVFDNPEAQAELKKYGFAEGGAVMGVYPSAGRRRHNDREGAKEVPPQLLRSAFTNTYGFPGTLEGWARAGLRKLGADVDPEPSIFPDPAELSGALSRLGYPTATSPAGEAGAAIGDWVPLSPSGTLNRLTRFVP